MKPTIESIKIELIKLPEFLINELPPIEDWQFLKLQPLLKIIKTLLSTQELEQQKISDCIQGAEALYAEARHKSKKIEFKLLITGVVKKRFSKENDIELARKLICQIFAQRVATERKKKKEKMQQLQTARRTKPISIHHIDNELLAVPSLHKSNYRARLIEDHYWYTVIKKSANHGAT